MSNQRAFEEMVHLVSQVIFGNKGEAAAADIELCRRLDAFARSRFGLTPPGDLPPKPPEPLNVLIRRPWWSLFVGGELYSRDGGKTWSKEP